MRERMMRMLKAGARALSRERWQKLVEEAERALDEHRPKLAALLSTEPTSRRFSCRVVKLLPTQLVVDAQLVVDLEFALAHAEALRIELESLASSEIDAARRELLKRRIDEACRRIERRIRVAPS